MTIEDGIIKDNQGRTIRNYNKIIKDNQGRTIITIGDNGKIVVGRFTDLSEEYKDYIVRVYADTVDCSEKDVKELIDFLNFKEEDDEFCV